MDQFVIHSVPGSPFGRAVFIALEEKGAPYRLAAMAPGSQRSPEHLARHPFGRVPIMDHGAFRLYETQAILRYIDRVLPQPALTPTRPQAAGRMDQLMNVNDWYLFQGVQNVIGFQRIIAPRLRGALPDEAAIAAAMPKAHVVIDEFARLLGDQLFFRRRFDQPGRRVAGSATGLPGRDAGVGDADGEAREPSTVVGANACAPKFGGDHLGARRCDGEGRVSGVFAARNAMQGIAAHHIASGVLGQFNSTPFPAGSRKNN
jgi:glutathione S-transferase